MLSLIKKKIFYGILGIIFLFVLLNVNLFVNADQISEGMIYKEYDSATKTVSIKINDSYFWNGTGYQPLNISFTSINENGYDWKTTSAPYTLYAKSNSNFGDGIKYCIGSQCLTYQASDYSYRDVNKAQDYISSISGVTAIINQGNISYNNVFSGVNLKYINQRAEVKEQFILNNLTRQPAGFLNQTTITLDFGGYIKFPNLSIFSNGTNKTGQDFTTSGEIEFKNASNATLFFLPEPIAYDSNGSQINLQYEVDDQGGQIWFYVRTNFSWLNSTERVFPIYIDPPIAVDSTENVSVLQLTSPTYNYVTGGPDALVAELTLKDYFDNGGSLVDNMSFYDLNNGNATISKTVRWKYGIDYIVEECDEICFNETRTSWTQFTSLSEIPNKNIKIGLFTDTGLGDRIEWIPIIQGFQVSEWAAWDVSTASYDNINKSFSPELGENSLDGHSFSSDGTKMYAVDGDADIIFQYSLSEAWNISNVTYDNTNFDPPTLQAPAFKDIFFKPDGTKMYILSGNNKSVVQYSLSTAWNVSTAAYDNAFFNFSLQEGLGRGLFFKPDGTEMYIVGTDNDSVFQYSLSQAWNTSTASYNGIFSNISTQVTNPIDMFFKQDGTKMYAISSTNDLVYQYSLSFAWNVSSASYDNINFSVTSQVPSPTDIFFKPDGTKMYVTNVAPDNSVFQYSMAAIDSCSCPANNTNWEINVSHNCVIDFYCDIGFGNLSFVGTGNTTLNSTLYISNFENLSANQRINIGSAARITIG